MVKNTTYYSTITPGVFNMSQIGNWTIHLSPKMGSRSISDPLIMQNVHNSSNQPYISNFELTKRCLNQPWYDMPSSISVDITDWAYGGPLARFVTCRDDFTPGSATFSYREEGRTHVLQELKYFLTKRIEITGFPWKNDFTQSKYCTFLSLFFLAELLSSFLLFPFSFF